MQVRDHRSTTASRRKIVEFPGAKISPIRPNKATREASQVAGDRKRPMKCCLRCRKGTSASSAVRPWRHIEI